MFQDVGERLADQEVGRALDRLGIAPAPERPIRLDGDPQRQPRGSRLDGFQQSPIAQDRRMDSSGQLAQIFQRLPRVLLDLCQGGIRHLRIAPKLVTCQTKLGQERDDLLLHSIVDVPFDAAPLRLFRLHDPGPGGGQLLCLPVDLLQPVRQLGRQARIAYGQSGLPSQRLEEVPVLCPKATLYFQTAVDPSDALSAVQSGAVAVGAASAPSSTPSAPTASSGAPTRARVREGSPSR